MREVGLIESIFVVSANVTEKASEHIRMRDIEIVVRSCRSEEENHILKHTLDNVSTTPVYTHVFLLIVLSRSVDDTRHTVSCQTELDDMHLPCLVELDISNTATTVILGVNVFS